MLEFVYVAWFRIPMIICTYVKGVVLGVCPRWMNILMMIVHKQHEFNGPYTNYCDFLASLLNCDECRNNVSLCIKCSHFGKKQRKFEDKRVFFSNNVSSSGPSKYVKCGYCSDFYLRGMSNYQNCFLRRSDSIFGDEKRGPI